jgi:hypothetical protein
LVNGTFKPHSVAAAARARIAGLVAGVFTQLRIGESAQKYSEI